MKKITLLLFTLLVGTSVFAQFTFPTDAGPYLVSNPTITSINFNDAGNTAGVTSGTYGSVTITASWANNSDSWSSEAELSVTTSAGSTTLSGATTGAANSSNSTTLTFQVFLPSTYDPDVDGTLSINLNQTWSGSSSNWSNIIVQLNPFVLPPDCVTTPSPADAEGAATFSAFGTISFSWVAAGSGEPANSYEFFFGNTPGSLASLGTTTSTSVDVSNVNPGTWYWQVVPIGGGGSATGCPVWSFTTESVPAPTNDLCSGAIPLTPGTIFDANPIGGQTQWQSTDSGELPLPTCSVYDPTDTSGNGGDIWYSVVVPNDGNITIEIQGDPFGNGGDTAMQVYSGVCGSLVTLDCDDDGSTDDLYSLVSISNVSLANETIYIRVFEYSGNDILQGFKISAYSATLSNNDFDSPNSFTYFPNPVSNKLTLKAQQNIQNVSVFNMLGQEVIRTELNVQRGDLDMSSLQSGPYFVKVSINDTVETIKIIKK